ncbi:MAG TPA: STAS domain-containing protein [Thermoleophilaceae bacterium]|nr:STAS domain-containing protein [Thermoleophilaceae bacterium]
MSAQADIHTTSDAHGVVIARIAGEIDTSNAAGVGDRLTAAVPNTAPGMVLDLSELSYVDSSGVELLFRLGERLEDRRQRLAVALPEGAPIARVFEIVRFREKLPLVGSVAEAGVLLRGDSL